MPEAVFVSVGRRLASAGAAAALAATGVAVTSAPAVGATGAARAGQEVYRVPPNGVFTLLGRGWGHGHGMSQYGAYGAAKVRGLDYRQIVGFYYPTTDLVGQPLSTTVRVLLHAAPADHLTVAPRATGLTATTSVDGVPACDLPTALRPDGPDVTAWRARVLSTPDGPRMRLQGTTDGTTWARIRAEDCDPAWAEPMDGSITFDGGDVTDLVLGTATMPYRGKLRAAFTGSRVFVVNVVLLDDYLRSVVPSEMPASWSPAALQAQAVAARTYASYGIAHPKNRPYYDVYDDTRDQMYLGKSREVASTNAAVVATEDPDKQTADVLVDRHGDPAFTQFSSSDGGWTVAGGQAYMPAQRDPYDGLVPSTVHSWRSTVAASTITSVYGSQVGQLRAVVVTGRDGNGRWGGRVTEVTVRGSSGSVSVSGSTFRYALGLRSEWFRVLPPPGRPTQVSTASGDRAVTVTWEPPSVDDAAKVSGYRVVLQPGGIGQQVDADRRAATFTDVDPRDARTVEVTATSSVGPGRPAQVTTRVHRLAGGGGLATALTVSQATFDDNAAGGVVLARRNADAMTFGAAPLAAAHHAPVLLTAADRLPPATETEIRRVLPIGGTVHLLGGRAVIGDGVRSRLVTAGYHVVRHGGATAAAVARHVADDVAAARSVTTVVEVDTSDAAAAWVAGPAAASSHGVVLLTDNGALPAPTRRWLATHPDVSVRVAVGAAAATADPEATALAGADAARTARLVADRFFPTPRRATVVATGSTAAGLVAAARMAVDAGPLLLPAARTLGRSAGRYVAAHRDRLIRVDLVGGGLPYPVEAGVQHALLG